ncbi:hypothetical protein PAPYR_1165 [Paratrimastix pyriformis]|uniref:UBA domain-containing protein n=1 Tax=Paratrimastix pyriformis TaxID=342808 RepID=A0ABQ8UT50_9EUKA|nr:hypothetical protein PAPYR_1165 [Paratrimastix pyriformis]
MLFCKLGPCASHYLFLPRVVERRMLTSLCRFDGEVTISELVQSALGAAVWNPIPRLEAVKYLHILSDGANLKVGIAADGDLQTNLLWAAPIRPDLVSIPEPGLVLIANPKPCAIRFSRLADEQLLRQNLGVTAQPQSAQPPSVTPLRPPLPTRPRVPASLVTLPPDYVENVPHTAFTYDFSVEKQFIQMLTARELEEKARRLSTPSPMPMMPLSIPMITSPGPASGIPMSAAVSSAVSSSPPAATTTPLVLPEPPIPMPLNPFDEPPQVPPVACEGNPAALFGMGFPEDVLKFALSRYDKDPNQEDKALELVLTYQKLRDMGYSDALTKEALLLTESMSAALAWLNERHD